MKLLNRYFITALPNECGQNEVFDVCGSACEPSCRDSNPVACTFQCVIGCRCKDGFLRDDKGRCHPQKYCDTMKCQCDSGFFLPES
uniref:TIL domain-containing protein n=1 Tax=Angiostrongylus cantonensis TaxID=6313 RepID=A0A0K0D9D8_ANGCA